MPVSEQAWTQGMAELGAAFPAREEELSETALRGDVYRKALQATLTDRQWSHAVSEAIRMCEWFPMAARLVEFGATTPPPTVLKFTQPSMVCSHCEGTGFEPFERGGYSWVRYCPRGCVIPEKGQGQAPDYRTTEERQAESARGLERIKAALLKRGVEVGEVVKPMNSAHP